MYSDTGLIHYYIALHYIALHYIARPVKFACMFQEICHIVSKVHQQIATPTLVTCN
jgi:hypothetical protein